MKYYRIINPFDGSMTIENEIEIHQDYYAYQKYLIDMMKEQHVLFPKGSPDYNPATGKNYTFEDFINMLKENKTLKGEF